MRNGFQHLRTLADKNIYRLFAGGNHSWVLLDEIIPMRASVRSPSPLHGDKVASPNCSPTKDQQVAIGGISLTNQAHNQKSKLDNTHEYQRKAQEDREKKERLAKESVAKVTQDFIQSVMLAHK